MATAYYLAKEFGQARIAVLEKGYLGGGNGMILHGADAELLTREQVKEIYPLLNFDNARFPIKGALAQKRGGTVFNNATSIG